MAKQEQIQSRIFEEGLFPQPHRFDPSRFEVAVVPNTNSYMPFGKDYTHVQAMSLLNLRCSSFCTTSQVTTTYR
ncbi:hypothetical protein ACET3Z_005282 [Daucus carota]